MTADSQLSDGPINGVEPTASDSQAAEMVLNIGPNDVSTISWGGVLFQKPEENLHAFEMDGSYAILFVNKGTLHVTIDSKPLTISNNQALLIWPYERCVGVEPNTGDLRCQWLSFAIKRSSRRIKQGLIRIPRVSNADDPTLVAELFSMLTNEYHRNQSYGEEFRVLSSQGSHYLLLSLLSRLSPVPSEKSLVTSSLMVTAERAIDYIRASYANPITTADIARALDCSEGYIRTVFRKICGCTPSEQMTRVRMYNARGLLSTSRMPIGQVAQECGFTRLSYFTRVFTREHGVTPTRYRANHSRQYVVSGI